MAKSCICDNCKVELEVKFKARKDNRRYLNNKGHLENHIPCMRLAYKNEEDEERSLLQGIETHFCTVCGIKL